MKDEKFDALIESAKSGDRIANLEVLSIYSMMYFRMKAMQEAGLIEPQDAFVEWNDKRAQAGDDVVAEIRHALEVSDKESDEEVTFELGDIIAVLFTAFNAGAEWGGKNPRPEEDSKFYLVR